MAALITDLDTAVTASTAANGAKAISSTTPL
jgi:hypothetical protein